MNIEELVQTLSPGSIIEMFELDLRPITKTNVSGDFYYFHQGLNDLNSPVVWQGKTYQPFEIRADGFEVTSKGTLPRPTLEVSNVTGGITALVYDYGDLVGAKITRRRTFLRYLDAVNFPGGVNTEADPSQHLPDDVFFVERKVREDFKQVTFELASALDLEGMKLPSRIVIQNWCPWVYRRWDSATSQFVYDEAGGCSYTGSNYFDVNDKPVGDPMFDVCSKGVNGCKKRFGAKNRLSFGGFPGSRAYRL